MKKLKRYVIRCATLDRRKVFRICVLAVNDFEADNAALASAISEKGIGSWMVTHRSKVL